MKRIAATPTSTPAGNSALTGRLLSQLERSTYCGCCRGRLPLPRDVWMALLVLSSLMFRFWCLRSGLKQGLLEIPDLPLRCTSFRCANAARKVMRVAYGCAVVGRITAL